jgi:ABC-2 type transport system ATP-binding protein
LFHLGKAEALRRGDELLSRFDLVEAANRPVQGYSGGMRRRLDIAMSLISRPSVLFLDEPTTGLDPIGTRQVKDLIIALGKRGKTIILSSHLLADVEDCVDRMVILYGGKIRAQGTCGELLESRSRTSIETDTLDEDTVSEIDRLVRSRTGGAVLKVTRPRQTLEALFMDIVEKARAERLENAGASHGGQTASFLKGDEGDALIDKLVKAESTPLPEATPASPAPPAEPDPDLIGSLTRDEPPAPPTAKPPPKPVDTSEVDRSVIDSLLDPPSKPGGGGT